MTLLGKLGAGFSQTEQDDIAKAFNTWNAKLESIGVNIAFSIVTGATADIFVIAENPIVIGPQYATSDGLWVADS